MASQCPDLAQYRSDTVKTSYNITMQMGRWYETAYNDFAQVGASCQYADNALTNQGYEQNFRTIYGFIPYDEVDEYQMDQAVPGTFTKWKKGLKALLTLKNVVVDFTVVNGTYDRLIEYSCTSKAGVLATELRFSSRSENLDMASLYDMQVIAMERGIPNNTVSNISIVDHSKCKHMMM